MRLPTGRSWFAPIAVAAMLVAAQGASAEAASTPRPGPVQRTWGAAVVASLLAPELVPQGMNDPLCRPSRRHPRPLILVNGTFENSYANWSMFAPALRAAGYCVYGFDYGGSVAGRLHGIGDMRASAGELARVVERVRTATGATKVDLVGHSQGGLMPLYYLSVLGGSRHVHRMIGIEGPVQGMSAHGALTLIASNPVTADLAHGAIPAMADVTAGSPFIREIAAAGMVQRGVRYVSIVSRTSMVIGVQEARLPAAVNTENVVLQDVCPLDLADHGTVVYDDITLRIVMNHLDPVRARRPSCHLVLPFVWSTRQPSSDARRKWPTPS
jgi:triacylglycerol lipase